MLLICEPYKDIPVVGSLVIFLFSNRIGSFNNIVREANILLGPNDFLRHLVTPFIGRDRWQGVFRPILWYLVVQLQLGLLF